MERRLLVLMASQLGSPRTVSQSEDGNWLINDFNSREGLTEMRNTLARVVWTETKRHQRMKKRQEWRLKGTS